MKPQTLHAHEDRLLDFAYGELPAPEARAVESHLEGCTRCTELLDGHRRRAHHHGAAAHGARSRRGPGVAARLRAAGGSQRGRGARAQADLVEALAGARRGRRRGVRLRHRLDPVNKTVAISRRRSRRRARRRRTRRCRLAAMRPARMATASPETRAHGRRRRAAMQKAGDSACRRGPAHDPAEATGGSEGDLDQDKEATRAWRIPRACSKVKLDTGSWRMRPRQEEPSCPAPEGRAEWGNAGAGPGFERAKDAEDEAPPSGTRAGRRGGRRAEGRRTTRTRARRDDPGRRRSRSRSPWSPRPWSVHGERRTPGAVHARPGADPGPRWRAPWRCWDGRSELRPRRSRGESTRASRSA